MPKRWSHSPVTKLVYRADIFLGFAYVVYCIRLGRFGLVVRVLGVEPSAQPWEGYILAAIRYPRVFLANGATCRDRTGDLRVTNALLYQLS